MALSQFDQVLYSYLNDHKCNKITEDGKSQPEPKPALAQGLGPAHNCLEPQPSGVRP